MAARVASQRCPIAAHVPPQSADRPGLMRSLAQEGQCVRALPANGYPMQQPIERGRHQHERDDLLLAAQPLQARQ